MNQTLARLKFTELEQWLSSQQTAQSSLGTVEGTLKLMAGNFFVSCYKNMLMVVVSLISAMPL
jgi:hypothetical protein